MILLPAIDIKDGRCVRLVQGDFATVHQVADSPLAAARGFERQGAVWLHMVDLDGAKTGSRANAETVAEVVKGTGLQVELGGGIRDMQTAEFYLRLGVARVILGSAALKEPGLVAEAVGRYGEKIAVGIDAKEGLVAAEGWLDSSTVHYLDLARRMEGMGVETIIFTDISKDGTLKGPNLEQLAALSDAVGCNIIASGGIRDIDHIRALKEMNLYGAICGKSLYEGTLKLPQALKLAGEQYAG